MNRLRFLLATFAVAVFALGIYSCAKDEVKNEQNAHFTTENRNALPTVINGMLHFDTYSDFQAYITNLEQLGNDTNQVKTAYIQLGVDLTQEFLPNLTDYPLALRKEQQITGFTSARKAEETIINNALNSGDDSVFSIISEPYLKSALNADHSVHIGSRIFKFFNNDGLMIVFNNDWSTYNASKTKSYDLLLSGQNIIVTNQEPKTWYDFFDLDTSGKVISEKLYNGPIITTPASPLACDFSKDIRKTDLGNGKIRIELPSNIYDIYEWTFEDGSKVFGNPLIIDCSQKTSGWVSLDVWKLDPTVPAGKRVICSGKIQFFCKCGDKKEKPGRYENPNAGGSGKAVRIDALIWVKAGEIGCRSNLKAKGAFGIWYPLNWVHSTTGVCVDILGIIKKETGTGNNKECITVNIPLTTKCLQPGQSNGSIEQKLPQTGEIFRDPGKLSSGHRARLKVGGTFFGFGVDVPRLVLD